MAKQLSFVFKRRLTRQKIVKYFVRRYGESKGKSVAKRYRRLKKYKDQGRYKNGQFYCRLGRPITEERIMQYDKMCHKLVRQYLPALALYEASFNYDDLITRCHTEIFLALLDGFDPEKAMTCKVPDPVKRDEIIARKRANPEKTYSDAEKSIVWGRLHSYLRRTRWKYHPDQQGGKTENLEPKSLTGNYERSRGLSTDIGSIELNPLVLNRKDRFLEILEKHGEEAVREAFLKMSDMGKEELLDVLKSAQARTHTRHSKIMGEESWMSK